MAFDAAKRDVNTPTETPRASPEYHRRRVLLVEDHVVLREALADLINRSTGWAVCGQASGGAEAVELAGSFQPEVIVLDFMLTGQDGFDLVRTLSGLPCRPAVLVLSAIEELEIGERVIHAGARGYLNKRVDRTVLLRALHDVAEGKLVASQDTILRIAASRVKLYRREDRPAPISRLSDRELEIFCLLGAGLVLSEVARRFGLSPRTIESHRENIKNKLTLQNASDVVRCARQWCLGWDSFGRRFWAGQLPEERNRQ